MAKPTPAEWNATLRNLEKGAVTPAPDLAPWPKAQKNHMAWCRGQAKHFRKRMLKLNIAIETADATGHPWSCESDCCR